MATANENPPQVLCEEILAEARRESDQITQRARQEADALLAQGAAETEQARQERLDQARAEAARRRELILATVPVEANRLRSARIEHCLQSIRELIRRRVTEREGFDCREAVLVLAAEAVSRMEGDSFVLKLSPGDAPASGEGWVQEIKRRAGRAPLSLTIRNDPAITDGGVIVQDAEGRQVWDNRLLARLNRLWPELRRQVAVGAVLVPPGERSGGGT